jgi:hypothetical protein
MFKKTKIPNEIISSKCFSKDHIGKQLDEHDYTSVNENNSQIK